ncbi:ferredoxin--NADP reductase [Parasediminibacterium sp. JCM 36343]|uniref:ferredoxin--NADP reductase n=1 Tax=Parasediminibacterium sp. JCM 36343 TaxID=3374279 RepID=UPI00397E8D1D
MLEPWRIGKMIRIEDETPTTKRFWIQVPELEKFDFEPGQFVTLDLPIHEQKNKRWRSYSIASAPDGTNIFELVIVKLEGGAGTTYLFGEGKVGLELPLRGPAGKFTLPEIIDRDLYLVCTGTGIAPFRSMVSYIHAHQIPHKNIYLIFGCRTFADNLYYNELKQLEKEEDGFYFLPTYSRETEAPTGCHTGYVHGVYHHHVKANCTEEDPAPAYFYLCGWKNMVDEAKERLQQLGYDKKAIHLELYG